MFKKNGSMRGMQHVSTIIVIIPLTYIWESWSPTIYFSNKAGVGGVSFPTNSISPNDLVIKAWEYTMVVYFMEFPYPKYPFFKKLTKFQQCMFRRIHLILTSPDGSTKIPNNRYLYV